MNNVPNHDEEENGRYGAINFINKNGKHQKEHVVTKAEEKFMQVKQLKVSGFDHRALFSGAAYLNKIGTVSSDGGMLEGGEALTNVSDIFYGKESLWVRFFNPVNQ